MACRSEVYILEVAQRHPRFANKLHDFIRAMVELHEVMKEVAKEYRFFDLVFVVWDYFWGVMRLLEEKGTRQTMAELASFAVLIEEGMATPVAQRENFQCAWCSKLRKVVTWNREDKAYYCRKFAEL